MPRRKKVHQRRSQVSEAYLPLTKQCAAQLVYCDGCYEHGVIGVGVYSKDLGIGITKQLDGKGKGNAVIAECLAAIAALDECIKREKTDILLLSDSMLVVNWANGRYRTKSQTARKYVPTIRDLMSQSNARIRWIPGRTNLADPYSRNKVQV